VAVTPAHHLTMKPVKMVKNRKWIKFLSLSAVKLFKLFENNKQEYFQIEAYTNPLIILVKFHNDTLSFFLTK
jgi:hypothetical protein